MDHIDPEHHDGTSDATPGGIEAERRPGELAFTLLLLAASIGLFWSAFGISGFEKLSSPGAIPMATTAVMTLSLVLILLQTTRLPAANEESLFRDIIPPMILVFVGFLITYGFLLTPLGFLPTSAFFLIVSIKLLARRNWFWTLGVSLLSLILIWLIFRIVFTVLMPSGIVPEAEFIQFFRNLLNSGAS